LSERDHYQTVHTFQPYVPNPGPSLFELPEYTDTRSPELDISPGRVRSNDHASSIAGAHSVALRAGSQKARLVEAYEAAYPEGLTDEEAAKAAAVPDRSCYWKRCNELRDEGRIEGTGEFRPGLAGIPRMVCRLAEAS
jgi:hypothetical protein